MASWRGGVGFAPIPFISMATGYVTLGQKSAIKNELEVPLPLFLHS